MMGIKRIVAFAACMVLTCSAFAWGGFEHSIVAYIAQEYLTEKDILFPVYIFFQTALPICKDFLLLLTVKQK